MALEAVFERFTKQNPLTVMARLLMQQALSREWLDELFEHYRDKQYTRELLFSMVVDLMALVVLGLKPSLHAAPGPYRPGCGDGARFRAGRPD
jgi:hypothetical protein